MKLITLMYLVIFLISIVAISFTFIKCYKKNIKIENLFLIVFALMGMLYILVLPPYTSPDEATHYATIFYYTNLSNSENILDEDGYTIVRNTDLIMQHADHYLPSLETYYFVTENILDTNVDSSSASYYVKPLTEPITSYIPQEIGALIAKAFGINGIMTLYIMRIMTFLMVGTCFYYAIKITPIGKYIFFSVSLLPMVLELSTSSNYDSSINAMVFLFLAYLFYLKYKKKLVELKDILFMMIISVLMSPIKLIYVVLMLFVFIIPINKYRNKLYYIAASSSVFIVGLISIFIFRLLQLNGGGILKETTSYWGVQDVLANIPETVVLVLTTTLKGGMFYLNTMIGGQLGWLDINISPIFILGFIVVLICAAMSKDVENKFIFTKNKVFMLIICGIIYLVLCGIFMIACTPMDSDVILGIQGRYFIPILPVLLLLLKNKKIQMSEKITRFIPLAIVILNIAVVMNAFVIIQAR